MSLSAGGRPHTLSSLILFEIIWEKRWEEADLSDFYRTKLAFSTSQVQWALALCSRADQVFATQREGTLHSAITELGMRP